ncbi:hypothetical protein BT63DRAFT_424585 [Microthyrium microscopicum]|uniref:CHY-type domain-containing protein n=1 Tax=Microthyrium microscopicum TaxID=703497 RepID=A0A6A6UGS7_9PEZI|nr:hypothetical protein BT63DRAFT_424585 [Microthyrium microscopicum]
MASGNTSNPGESSRETQQRQYMAAPSPRIVPKPVPQGQLQDPRTFQLDQIRRRFSPLETRGDDNEAVLKFRIVPSDPDFPYEIAALQCTMTVPLNYPQVYPTLRVTNKEMERGYQINVEKGFNDIVSRMANRGTLLQCLNTLDRELETLLAERKAETIKITANPIRGAVSEASVYYKEPSAQSTRAATAVVPRPYSPPPALTYTSEQLEKAKKKRDMDTRQLEARLGRLPLYKKSYDGLTYTVPIEPRKRSELPQSLKFIKAIDLIVPAKYNLEPCTIELPGVVSEEIPALLDNFKSWVLQNPDVSLFAHINKLSQSMHLMAVKPISQEPLQITETTQEVSKPAATKADSAQIEGENKDKGKSHIVVIPRPPEWSTAVGGHSSDSDEYDESPSDLDEETDEEDLEGTNLANAPAQGPERGILLSFPNLELYGIELLELITLNLTVKCERCKDLTDVTNIKDSAKGDHSTIKTTTCKKCSTQISVGFRMDLMHSNCIRAGYLDLEGCTVSDMLPSHFTPSCSECSTPYPAPGIVSVRGDATMAICRQCHKRMTLKIPEIKFLQVSATNVRASQAPRKKKVERLGIKAGEQLPNRGRCSHYSKSYRWFRFSCCNKVFPCDKCHDKACDHPNEHANRMICGYCSREQNYRPEDCGVCHASLVARAGKGFWEGGKGTRDKNKMSRKDPRKYKRKPGTVKKE